MRSQSAWRDAPWWFSTRNFACWLPRPDIRIFPTLGPQRAKKAMISMVGLQTLTEELAPLMVKPQAGWGAVARSPNGRIHISCWPGCHNRSTSRARKSQTPLQQHRSALEYGRGALCPWAHGPVDRESRSCSFFDSKHGASICLGRVQTRGARMSAKVMTYHAAHLQSCAEPGK